MSAPGKPTSASYGTPGQLKAGAPKRQYYYTYTIGENTRLGLLELLALAELQDPPLMPVPEDNDEV